MKKQVFLSCCKRLSRWKSRSKTLNVKNFHSERQEADLLTSGNFTPKVERFWCGRREKLRSALESFSFDFW